MENNNNPSYLEKVPKSAKEGYYSRGISNRAYPRIPYLGMKKPADSVKLSNNQGVLFLDEAKSTIEKKLQEIKSDINADNLNLISQNFNKLVKLHLDFIYQTFPYLKEQTDTAIERMILEIEKIIRDQEFYPCAISENGLVDLKLLKEQNPDLESKLKTQSVETAKYTDNYMELAKKQLTILYKILSDTHRLQCFIKKRLELARPKFIRNEDDTYSLVKRPVKQEIYEFIDNLATKIIRDFNDFGKWCIDSFEIFERGVKNSI